MVAPGINGKMSEFNAALGLLQLKYIDQALARRKEIDAAYRERLQGVKGIRCLNDAGEKVANYAYFPILVEADYPISRDELYQKLKDNGIHPRRYFYPLISDFPMYRGLPSAHREICRWQQLQHSRFFACRSTPIWICRSSTKSPVSSRLNKVDTRQTSGFSGETR